MYVNGIEDMLFSIYVSAILRSIVCVFVTKNIRMPAGMITTNGQADRFKIQPMYALAFIAYGYEKEISTKYIKTFEADLFVFISKVTNMQERN